MYGDVSHSHLIPTNLPSSLLHYMKNDSNATNYLAQDSLLQLHLTPHSIANRTFWCFSCLIAMVHWNSPTVVIQWEQIEWKAFGGSLRNRPCTLGRPMRNRPFIFKKANTEPSMHFRKANTGIYIILWLTPSFTASLLQIKFTQ